ncbi:DNA-directed RNA polymerase subunit alpha C-terminal domain-containing protein [Abiotrophia defectiva]|uniref:ORC-CDC6 family AAA ATPase n=1 Tax=Abiotrophia defectiva TaxID=46125 RepID=UPI0028D87E38|nr:DNA-directed RNA polymerase subunit alpha C-terminal domain-containing protein [Abiotrophia defectiva]
MNTNFIIRTEDIKLSEIRKIYVETESDRNIINKLKSSSQLLLIGSRGIGKTMLMKMAESELNSEYSTKKELPVYLSFSKSMLVNNSFNNNFQYWMYAKLLNGFRNAILEKGIITANSDPFKMLFNHEESNESNLDKFIKILESSWRDQKEISKKEIVEILGIDELNFKVVDDIDFIKRIIEEFCVKFSIQKVIFYFDEACHNFIPKQQREFFSMFRDLRSPYICCKAAVYPGISYYSTLQLFHDVNSVVVERDINDKNYINSMREMVNCQIDDANFIKKLENEGQCFDALIMCCDGNPRLLLKSIEQASEGFKSFKKNKVSSTIKDFYRVQIWQEHTKLSTFYSGHKEMIDWGRTFIERDVLEETKNKNEKNNKKTIFFAIHKDAPESVKSSVRILEYSGIIRLHTEGTKVRGEVYDRYQLNLGVVVASEGTASVVERSREIFDNLSIKIYTEYGKNSPVFNDINKGVSLENAAEDMNLVLKNILKEPLDTLDLTQHKKNELQRIGIKTIEDIIKSTEEDLQKGSYIGPVYSRKIHNIAQNAALEYISG